MKHAERPGASLDPPGVRAVIDHGFLDEDEPIELLDGLLLVKEPQSSPHRTACCSWRGRSSARSETGFVQVQSPIASMTCRTEPDSALSRLAARLRPCASDAPGADRRGRTIGSAHGAGRKATAYARGGIADYWIVNLVDRVAASASRTGAPARAPALGYAAIRRWAPTRPWHRSRRRPRASASPISCLKSEAGRAPPPLLLDHRALEEVRVHLAPEAHGVVNMKSRKSSSVSRPCSTTRRPRDDLGHVGDVHVADVELKNALSRACIGLALRLRPTR